MERNIIELNGTIENVFIGLLRERKEEGEEEKWTAEFKDVF